MAVARAIKDVFVVSAKRTPFGTYGGKLSKKTATDLLEVAMKSSLEAGGIKPEWVSSVIIGNVFHASVDGAYTPRHASLRVGLPVATPAHAVNRLCGSGFQAVVSGCQVSVRTVSDLRLLQGASSNGAVAARHAALRIAVPREVPAMLVNRLCGSGFQAVVSGAEEINLGVADVVVTGGAENMSLSPHSVWGARFGAKLGEDLKMVDVLWQGLIDQQIKTPMGVTAENLAEQYSITREQCDEFALASQHNWGKAQEAGHFKAEMAPVTVKTKKGEVAMDMDEHPRPSAKIEDLAKLPPVFKKNGTVSAGNASGICDGAGCVVLVSEAALTRHSLTPLARITGYGVSGCDPAIMGIGPVPAVQALTKATGTSLADMDLFEVNEAFAPQALAVMKALEVDPAKTNVNGGAISLGHPVGASGARITGHLVHELRRRGAKKAIGSACIGGGQGIAVLVETV